MKAVDELESSSADRSSYDQEEDLNLLLRRILALASFFVNSRLRNIGGPTEAQWRPLHCLYTRGSLRVIELARFCEIDPAGMTRLIDRLEHKGLCRRLRSPLDRRVVEVILTERGAESAKRVELILHRVQAELLADFDSEQRNDLLHLLSRLANIEQTWSVLQRSAMDEPISRAERDSDIEQK